MQGTATPVHQKVVHPGGHVKLNSLVGKNPEHNSEVIAVRLCGEH